MILGIDPGDQKNYKQKGKYGSKKEDGLTNHQRYYQRHREKMLLCARLYRKKHKPELAAYQKEYRKKNPDLFKTYEIKRVRPKEQRMKFNEYCKTWKKENPDKRLAQYQRRRSKLDCSTLTQSEIKKLREDQNGLCFYCGNNLDNNGRGHLEHKTPLSRGGKNDKNNVVFSCSSCNLKKGRKTHEEFNGYIST